MALEDQVDKEDKEESLGLYELSEKMLDPDSQASKEPTLLSCLLEAVSITLETVSVVSIDESELQISIDSEHNEIKSESREINS